MKYVQFADKTESTIVSIFCGPQDELYHQNLGQVEDDDPRVIEFYKRLNFEVV